MRTLEVARRAARTSNAKVHSWRRNARESPSIKSALVDRKYSGRERLFLFPQAKSWEMKSGGASSQSLFPIHSFADLPVTHATCSMKFQRELFSQCGLAKLLD
jgi:hypothetical protein